MATRAPDGANNAQVGRKVQMDKQPNRQEQKETSLTESFLLAETSEAQRYSNGSSLQRCLIDHTMNITARNVQG